MGVVVRLFTYTTQATIIGTTHMCTDTLCMDMGTVHIRMVIIMDMGTVHIRMVLIMDMGTVHIRLVIIMVVAMSTVVHSGPEVVVIPMIRKTSAFHILLKAVPIITDMDMDVVTLAVPFFLLRIQGINVLTLLQTMVQIHTVAEGLDNRLWEEQAASPMESPMF